MWTDQHKIINTQNDIDLYSSTEVQNRKYFISF